MLQKYIEVAKRSKKQKEEDEKRLDPRRYSLQFFFDKAAYNYKEPNISEVNLKVQQLSDEMTSRDVLIFDLQREVKLIKKEIKWLKKSS